MEILPNHPNVLFVGDKPAKNNINEFVAFYGTQSYTTLMKWCDQMMLHHGKIHMVNQCHIINLTQAVDFVTLHYATDHKGRSDKTHLSNCKVIALGRAAESRLIEMEIEHFLLPHPSGLNRALNNKLELATTLSRCRDWIFN